MEWLMHPWGAVIWNGYPIELVNASLVWAGTGVVLLAWGLIEIGRRIR